MVRIGHSINGVAITFSEGADAEVDQALVDVLKQILIPNMIDGYPLRAIHVSSTSEANAYHSNPKGPHRQGLAIDISRINGHSIRTAYDANPEVHILVNMIQILAQQQPGVCENHGPLVLRKHQWKLSEPDELRRGPKETAEAFEKRLANRRGLRASHDTHIHIRVHSDREKKTAAARKKKVSARRR